MAILGHGDIASILTDREGAIFFASGVSDSQCTNKHEFEREARLLFAQPTTKHLFYFSTISIYLVQSAYTKHKLDMEDRIKRYFPSYTIIRIGNITWGTNPNTFLNNMRTKKKNGEQVVIRDEFKYMINQEQLLALTNSLPLTGQRELCVFGEMKKVAELI